MLSAFSNRQWGNINSNGALITPIAYNVFLQIVASWDDVSIASHSKLAVGAGTYNGKLEIVGIDGNMAQIGIRWILLCK